MNTFGDVFLLTVCMKSDTEFQSGYSAPFQTDDFVVIILQKLSGCKNTWTSTSDTRSHVTETDFFLFWCLMWLYHLEESNLISLHTVTLSLPFTHFIMYDYMKNFKWTPEAFGHWPTLTPSCSARRQTNHKRMEISFFLGSYTIHYIKHLDWNDRHGSCF